MNASKGSEVRQGASLTACEVLVVVQQLQPGGDSGQLRRR